MYTHTYIHTHVCLYACCLGQSLAPGKCCSPNTTSSLSFRQRNNGISLSPSLRGDHMTGLGQWDEWNWHISSRGKLWSSSLFLLSFYHWGQNSPDNGCSPCSVLQRCQHESEPLENPGGTRSVRTTPWLFEALGCWGCLSSHHTLAKCLCGCAVLVLAAAAAAAVTLRHPHRHLRRKQKCPGQAHRATSIGVHYTDHEAWLKFPLPIFHWETPVVSSQSPEEKGEGVLARPRLFNHTH